MDTTDITVKLVPDAVADLEAEKAASWMNTHDVVNRALRLYHFMMEEERGGNQMHIKETETGDLKRVAIVLDPR